MSERIRDNLNTLLEEISVIGPGEWENQLSESFMPVGW